VWIVAGQRPIRQADSIADVGIKVRIDDHRRIAIVPFYQLYHRSQRAPVAEPADFVAQPQTSQSSVIVTTIDPRAEKIE
jgi:hypothetical protein